MREVEKAKNNVLRFFAQMFGGKQSCLSKSLSFVASFASFPPPLIGGARGRVMAAKFACYRF